MAETGAKRSPSAELDPHAQGCYGANGRWFRLYRLKYLFDRRNRPVWDVSAVCHLRTLMADHGLRIQVVKNDEQQFQIGCSHQ